MIHSGTARFIFVAAALQLPVAVPPQQPQPPLPPATVEGIIIDGTTNRPLSNVTVSQGQVSFLLTNGFALADFAPGAITGGSTVTTDDGRFTLAGISPGTQTISARKAGYVDYRPEGRQIAGFSGLTIALTPDQKLQGVVLKMFPAAIVTGRVVDLKGEPVTGATVYALRFGYNDLGELVPKVVTTFGTDDRGEYRFNSLPQGSYGFRFERNLVRFGQGNPPSYYAGKTVSNW